MENIKNPLKKKPFIINNIIKIKWTFLQLNQSLKLNQ